MDAERARAFLLTLPYAAETQQWGENLVFWVGDKTVGGKMFALLNLAADGHGVISFAAGPERFAEFVEQEGFVPAPYFARIFWVSAERWSALRDVEWKAALTHAHFLVHGKMPKRIREALQAELPRKRRPAAKAKT